MESKYEIYKKGTCKMAPFIIENKAVKGANIAVLAEENNPKNLGFGIFRMYNTTDLVNITFPSDEVIIILKGKYYAKVGKNEINFDEGDIFYARKGLNVIFGTDSFVEIFFVNYPI